MFPPTINPNRFLDSEILLCQGVRHGQVATTSHGSAVVMKLLESGVGGDELEIRLVQRRKAPITVLLAQLCIRTDWHILLI